MNKQLLTISKNKTFMGIRAVVFTLAFMLVSMMGMGQTAYITNSYDSSVTVINVATNTVIDAIKVGNNPNGVSVSPDGSKVYVTDGYDSVYPNPATNQLTIHSSSFHNEGVMVSVVNMLGQVAMSCSLSFGEGRGEAIDVSGLPAGMYFVEMKTESGSVVKRFVKE